MAFENWERFVNQTKADLERQKAEELRKVKDKRTTAKNYKPYSRRSQHNH